MLSVVLDCTLSSSCVLIHHGVDVSFLRYHQMGRSYCFVLHESMHFQRIPATRSYEEYFPHVLLLRLVLIPAQSGRQFNTGGAGGAAVDEGD